MSEAALAPSPNPEGDAEPIRRRILAQGHQSKVTAALLHLLECPDLPVSKCALEYDIDAENLRRWVHRYGMAPSKTALLSQAKRVAYAAGLKVENALENDEISSNQAPVVYGIFSDKAKALEATTTHESPLEGAIAAVVSQLKAGESLSITVKRESADPVAEAIEVESL